MDVIVIPSVGIYINTSYSEEKMVYWVDNTPVFDIPGTN